MRRQKMPRLAALGAVAVLAALALALRLGGLIFDVQGMQFTVVNHTDQGLEVRIGDQPKARVASGGSTDVELGSPGSCLGAVWLSAVAEEGSLVAKSQADACDGDTWTVEQSDLVSRGDHITVANHTDVDLLVQGTWDPAGTVDPLAGEVTAGTSRALLFDGCVYRTEAISADMALIAHDRPQDILCDGGTWTIEQDDLRKLTPTSPATPAP